MRTHSRSPGSKSFDLDTRIRGRTSVLPFLPTLVTAFVIAAASLLCRAPAESTSDAAQAPARAFPAMLAQGLDGFPAQPQTSPASGSIPATLAFGRMFPLTTLPAGEAQNVAALPRAGRIANASRRSCAAGRCGETRREGARDANRDASREIARNTAPPSRYLPDPPTVSAISDPFRDDPAAGGDSLPDGVLPFMPTAASVLDTVRSIGSNAANLGGSVASSIGSML